MREAIVQNCDEPLPFEPWLIDRCKDGQTGNPNDALLYFTHTDDNGDVIYFGYVYYFLEGGIGARAIIFDRYHESEGRYHFVNTVVTNAFLMLSRLFLTEFQMFYDIDESAQCIDFMGSFPDTVCRILELKKGVLV